MGKLQAAANTSHKVTEYFPIRRSERKPKAELLKEELETISERLSVTDDSRHGIEVVPIENKGRGIKVSWSTCNTKVLVFDIAELLLGCEDIQQGGLRCGICGGIDRHRHC